MKSIIAAAVLTMALAGGGATAAWADEFSPAPNASYVIDLDTPDDSISLWRLDELSGVSGLRSQVTMRRVGKPRSVKPGVFVILSNDRESVTFILLATPKGSAMTLLTKRGEERTGAETFLSVIDPGETFGLAIDWTAEGKVTFRVASKAVRAMGGQGFERHELLIDGAPTKIEIYGMAGEVEFKPLILGSP